jgi:hypothetical protein
MNEKQIRETIARMEAESAAAPLARRGKRTTLLNLALKRDAGALFVLHHNAVRLGVIPASHIERED